MIPKGVTEYSLICIWAIKNCSLSLIVFWPEKLPNFREFIQVRATSLSDLRRQLKFQKLIKGDQIDLDSAYL